MYVLTKLEPRAETTDTILYFASKTRTPLEEILLALYDEAVESKALYPNIPDEILDKRINDYMKKFNIIKVPYLED